MPYFGEKEVEIYQGAVCIFLHLMTLIEEKVKFSESSKYSFKNLQFWKESSE